MLDNITPSQKIKAEARQEHYGHIQAQSVNLLPPYS